MLFSDRKMRQLKEQEMKSVIEKLMKYIGDNVRKLIERTDHHYSFRLHNDRVFYAREDVITAAITVPRKKIISVGTCIGKFTKTGKFKLLITALPVIADYAQYKVWLKPSSEQSFLYGNHVTKGGLGRITENTPAYAGVVVYSMGDVPLGFGVSARSTADCRRAQPITNVLLHQSDVGEYIRSESELLT